MPISTLTAITPIAEGSEATPGLFNSRFSQIQQNVDELNIQAIGLLSGFVTGGSGSPESVQTGTPGFIYVQLDAAAEQHPVWVKFTGSGTTGWRGFDGFQGTGIDSYQIGRGASAAGLNASAIGPSSGAAASASQAWGYLASANQPSAVAVGPNSRSSGPNAVALGLNTYAGQINAIALGSAATSNATGGVAFGSGVQVSHQSTWVFSSVPASSVSINELQVSGFSALRVIPPIYLGLDGENFTASGVTLTVGEPQAGGKIMALSDGFVHYESSQQTVLLRSSLSGLLLGSNYSSSSNRSTGLPYLPTCTGIPAQVPVNNGPSYAPMIVDSVNTRLYIYVGGAWKFAALS